MKQPNKPKGYWTEQLCYEEALKYSHKKDFELCSRGAFRAAYRNGWFDKCCEHMSKPTWEFKWTRKTCQEEAIKYKTRTDFARKSGGAYSSSLKNGWLNDICIHMTVKNKPKGYWTKEKCQKEALKYNSKKDFKINSGSAYSFTYKNGWSDELCSHMIEARKPNHYWDKAKCHEEAKKYLFRKSFQKFSSGAYSIACQNGWLDDVCSHMSRPTNWRFKWTKTKCHEEAKKYLFRKEFQRKACGAYNSSLKNGWLDDVCSHMEKQGNRFNRWVYIYIFPNKYAYVGLTFNKKKRNNEHKFKGSVHSFINNNGYELPEPFYVVDKPVPVEEAIELEELFVNILNGWDYKLLNRNKTGAIGTITIKWTREKCQKEAMKYLTRTEFSQYSSGAYHGARKNGWLNEICSHMIEIQKPFGYWTKENCQKEALKYKTRNVFRKNSSGAYQIVVRNGWLNEICSHMIVLKKPKNHWTKENCQKEAKRYGTLNEWINTAKSSYSTAGKRGWVPEIKKAMGW